MLFDSRLHAKGGKRNKERPTRTWVETIRNYMITLDRINWSK